MALAAAIVWEVRTGGSDNSGGGFKTGAAGTDFSQQDAAQDTGTNLTVDAVDNTKVTPDAHTPAAADVGNVIQITAGIGYTTGFYEITAQDGVEWTLDRSPAAIGVSGGTWALGGALVSPGKAGSAHVAGNTIYVKAGTYTITSASTNVAGGCPSLTTPSSTTTSTRLIGYNTTRDDDGTKPLLQASGISTFALVTLAQNTEVRNLSLDGASLTSSRGVAGGTGTFSYLCKAANCTNSGFSAGIAILCEATGCATQAAFNVVTCIACTSYSNTISGFLDGNCIDCVSANNTGASSDGFNITVNQSRYVNCKAYTNGRSGFNFSAPSAAKANWLINCISYNNVTSDYGSLAFDFGFLIKCAGVTVDADITAKNKIGFVTLTGDPFANAAGNDFSLNNTAGAGAACRAAGIPGSSSPYTLPGLSTNSYPDLGASQHQETGGTNRAALPSGVSALG